MFNLALGNLSKCYIYGIGVERNPSEAFRVLTKYVEVHKAWLGYLSLAKLYVNRIGAQANLEKMAELYRRGTELLAWKRPYYQGYYGLCLIRGLGLKEDKKSGWKMIQQSIQSNNATGWDAKGERYRFRYGVTLNSEKAVQCYKRATQMDYGTDGKIVAKFALGCMYELGEGRLPQNFETALVHFNYAANRMHQGAQWKMRIFCESGIGTDRFKDSAVYYFRLAANSGHRQAQLKVSMYYMQGKGVSRGFCNVYNILTSAIPNRDHEGRRIIVQRDRQLRKRRL